jgi:hypothetical protein
MDSWIARGAILLCALGCGFAETTSTDSTDRQDTAAASTARMVRGGAADTIQSFYLSDENMGYFEAGFEIIPMKTPRFVTQTIGVGGLRLGFGFPLRFPFMLTYVRLRASFHGALNDFGPPKEQERTYITASNELTFGRRLSFTAKTYELYPHLSLGFSNGIAVSSGTEEGLKGHNQHYYLHWGVGLAVRKRFVSGKTRFAVGLQLSYERAFVRDEDAKQRLGLTALAAY